MSITGIDGSLRVDANISVRRSDCPTLGVRTEIKNVSGFRVLAKAVGEYVIALWLLASLLHFLCLQLF